MIPLDSIFLYVNPLDRIFLDDNPLDSIFLDVNPLDRIFLDDNPLDSIFLDENLQTHTGNPSAEIMTENSQTAYVFMIGNLQTA